MLLETGIPYTTNKGWLLPVKELTPLIKKFADPPKLLFVLICTPLTFPVNELTTLFNLTVETSLPLTDCDAYPKLFFALLISTCYLNRKSVPNQLHGELSFSLF